MTYKPTDLTYTKIDFKVSMNFVVDINEMADRAAAKRLYSLMLAAQHLLDEIDRHLEANTGLGFTGSNYVLGIGAPTDIVGAAEPEEEESLEENLNYESDL